MILLRASLHPCVMRGQYGQWMSELRSSDRCGCEKSRLWPPVILKNSSKSFSWKLKTQIFYTLKYYFIKYYQWFNKSTWITTKDPSVSSQPGALPPELLTEPYVTLSRHTALVIEPLRPVYRRRQCAKRSGIR